MPPVQDPGIDHWLTGIRRRDPTIGAEEERALRDVFSALIHAEPDRDIVHAHQRPTDSHLLLEGWAYRYLTLSDGRRQIVSVHMPGEFIDLHSFPLQMMDHSIGAFTPCRIALAPHARLRQVTERHPHLARVFWLSTLVDAAIHRQWLLGAGQRSALERIAHLLCELCVRVESVGLSRDRRFRLPMLQSEIADAMGITSVHANRIVQELRGQLILTWQGREVVILDWERLAGIAEFDPTYLNLFPSPR